jgi:hypothetical protein
MPPSAKRHLPRLVDQPHLRRRPTHPGAERLYDTRAAAALDISPARGLTGPCSASAADAAIGEPRSRLILEQRACPQSSLPTPTRSTWEGDETFVTGARLRRRPALL